MIQREGSAKCEVRENQRQDKGKSEMGESSGAVESWTAPGKEICDVAATSEVAVTQTLHGGSENARDKNCKRQEIYVVAQKIDSSKEGDSSHVEEGRPNKRVGLSIYTPTQATQVLDLTPQNSKGGSESYCQVYSKKRRYQKKLNMGHLARNRNRNG